MVDNMIILHKEIASTKSIQHLVNHYHARGYTASLTTASEIYIGSYFPFNNFFIHQTSENGNTSAMSVEYWDGSQFRTAPHITDETELDGSTLAQDGFVSFIPDELYPWVAQDARNIPDISDQIYYNQYWVRITFSADLTEDVIIKFLGHCFCSDNEIYGEFFKFSTVDWLDAWGADKVDWLEQRITATNLIIGELKTIGKIRSGDQILERISLKDACVQMVAYMVYLGSGVNYQPDSESAFKEAMRRLKQGTVIIDSDNNGIYNKTDTKPRITSWSR